MWSSMIFTAVLGKEKSLETFCFKAFSVVEATGLEPTTFWSLTKRATKLRYASICSSRAFPPNDISNYNLCKSFSQAFFIAFCKLFSFFFTNPSATAFRHPKTATKASQRILQETPQSATQRTPRSLPPLP